MIRYYIKDFFIAIALFFSASIHYFFPEKPQEKVADYYIESVIKKTTGKDIHEAQEGMDEIVDTFVEEN